MADLNDLPTPSSNTPVVLDPIETVRQSTGKFTLDDLSQAVQAPAPRPLTPHDLGGALMGDLPIKMDEAAPADPTVAREMQRQLRFETEFSPAESHTVGNIPGLNYPIAGTPYITGMNPNIDYGKDPESAGFDPLGILKQVALGVVQGGAGLRKQAGGLEALLFPALSDTGLQTARGGDEAAKQIDQLGEATGGPNIVRHLSSSVTEMAPEMVAGAAGGLLALAVGFGLSSAGSSFADAKEAGYAHPEMYAVASGLIGFGTAFIPGYQGRNVVAKAASLTESSAWKDYLKETIDKYAAGDLLHTHGGAQAIQGGIQSVAQGMLNKGTVDPNLTWSDIVKQGFQAAGYGALLGEGFGAVHHAEANSLHAQAVTELFQDFNKNIDQSMLRGGESELRSFYPNWKPNDPRAFFPGSLRPESTPPSPDLSTGTSVPVTPRPSDEDQATSYEVTQRNAQALGSLRPQVTAPEPVKPIEQPAPVAPPTPAAPVAAVPEPVKPVEQPAPVTPQESPQQAVARLESQIQQLSQASPEEKALNDKVFNNEATNGDIDRLHELGVARARQLGRLSAELEHTQRTAAAPAGPQEAPVTFAQWQEPFGTVPPVAWYKVNETFTPAGSKTPFRKGGVVSANELQRLGYKVPEAPAYAAPEVKAPEAPKPAPTPAPAATPAPVAEKPAADAPTVVTGRLPNKGERVPIAENYFVTRNRQGKVVLQQEGSNRTLATLRGNKPEALTKEAIFADLRKQAEGARTSAWDINIKDKANPLWSKAASEVAKEDLHAAPEVVAKEVVGKLGSKPEQVAVAEALTSGAIAPEVMTRLVGEATARKGPEAIARALSDLVKKSTTKYLNGKLLERQEIGDVAQVPRELVNQETGAVLKKAEIEKLFPDKKSLAARVLNLLVSSRQVDLAVENAKRAESVAPAERPEGGRGPVEVTSPDAAQSVTKTGFTDESVVTKFTDDMLMTNGKLDQSKVRAAEEVNEIKDMLRSGEEADYDKAKRMLVGLFGFTEAKAEQWLDSDSSLLAYGGVMSKHYVDSEKPYRENFVLEGPAVVQDRSLIGGDLNSKHEPEQLYNRLKNLSTRGALNPAEFDIYDRAGLREFLNTKPTLEALSKWMQENGPRIKVAKLTNKPSKLTPHSEEYQRLQHEWYDALPEEVRPSVARYLREFDEEPYSVDSQSWLNQAVSDLPEGYRQSPSEFRRTAIRYAELDAEFHGDTVYEQPEGSSHWAFVGPKNQMDMPGYTEIAVTEPNVGVVEGFPSSHEFPPNTVAFVRGYMETAPDGRKIWHVIEVQSDWAQEVRRMKSEQAEGSRAAGKIHHDDPLLRDYERLALKAAIEHALSEGADSIAISDAETAMMSEGHDRASEAATVATYDISNWDTQRRVRLERELATKYPEPHYTIHTGYSDIRVDDNTQRTVGQEAGMRLHYDRTLPKLLEELTGQKGERVGFGEHEKARSNQTQDTLNDQTGEFQRVPKLREDLIFRNPDGTPKTDATAREFSLSKVANRGNPFSLMGKDKLSRDVAALGPEGKKEYGKLRLATRDDFASDAEFNRYQERGLLSGNLIAAIQSVAARNNQFSELANDLLKFQDELGRVATGNLGGNSRTSYYDPDSNTAKISLGLSDALIDEHVMHEAVHALAVRRLVSLGEHSPEATELKQLMEALRAAYPDAAVGTEVEYALRNVHEFLSVLTTSEAAQQAAKKVTVGNMTLWERFKNWIYKLVKGKNLYSVGSKTSDLLERILTANSVSTSEWLEAYGTHDIYKAPEIRNLQQYSQVKDYRYDELPAEERELITRKAVANNQWVRSPEIQTILNGLPDEVKSLLKPIFGTRDAVIEATKNEPGATLDNSYQAILRDPNLPGDRKAEISLSVLHNLLQFDHQAEKVTKRLADKYEQLKKLLPNLDKGITESTASVLATENAVKNLVGDFKNRILQEKAKSVSDERTEQLNRMVKMVDSVRGRETALGKFLDAVAEIIPLQELADQTSRSDIHALIKQTFPLNEETARRVGASVETMRLASWVIEQSNILRAQLLGIKLAKDPGALTGVLEIDAAMTEDLRKGDINKALTSFAAKMGRYGAQRAQAQQLYQVLFRDKSRRLDTIRKLGLANDALQKVKQTASFKDVYRTMVTQNELMKPLRVRENTGQYTFTHPLTREPVTVGMSFESDTEIKNLTALKDLADAAKFYISNTQSEKYDPKEADFWKTFVRNTAFMLDPTIGVNGRKLLKAAYDPYRVTAKLGGGLVQVPDHVLTEVGGRYAVEAEVGLQAVSAIMSQLSTLKGRYDASLTLTAKTAADAHGLSFDDWHTEVLNPLIASRQQTGYNPLRVGGPPTIFGHAILKEDEAAFAKQLEFDRKIVAVATKAHGNTAVAFDPSKVTFKSPTGETLTRKISTTGRDTMPRRLGYWTDALATQWFANSDVLARKQFMDDNFLPVVMGHLDTVGAPDYSIRSRNKALYTEAIKQHGGTPINTVDELLDTLFDAQNGRFEPEQQVSREQILATLIEELDKVFQNVSKFREGQPKTDVGALLKVVDTDNSFTQARGNLIAPTTFYDYGLTFDHNRIGRVHSALSYYTLNLAGRNGLLDNLAKAIDAHKANLRTQIGAKIRAGATEAEAVDDLEKESTKKQLDGKSLLTYSQADTALRQVNSLRGEIERVLTRTGPKSDQDALIAANSVQSFVSANVLAGATSRNKHMFFGLINLMALNKLILGRPAAWEMAKLAPRVLAEATKEFTAMTLGAGKVGEFTHEVLRSPVFGKLGTAMSDALRARVELHRAMEDVGLAPVANVREDLRALWALPTEGGRPHVGMQSTAGKVGHALETALRTVSVPLTAVTTRPVDRLLNIIAAMHADDVESSLKMNALKAGRARDELGQRGVFTAPEIFGTAKANPKQELLFRQIFRSQALSLDQLMWRYHDAVKAGADGNTTQFFTPEERAAFKYAFAQNVSLPTLANRPLGSRGSRFRNFVGLFWGVHLWQASQYSRMMSRTSTDKSTARYVPSTIATLFTIAAMGATATVINNTWKKKLYGETSPNISLLDVHSPKQAAEALATGFAAYMPSFVGALINGVVLNDPLNTGFDINSQFVMLNFANDIWLTTKKIYQTNDAVRPVEGFLRRWSPLTRIVIDRLPGDTGLTEYYNLARDLKNLAPADMETKKRGASSFDATPATPILQDMINAAYRGDDAGFQKASDRYMLYEQSLGKSPEESQQSLKAAWRSRNPYSLEFGRLPTEAEQAAIYAAASPQQRAALDKATDVFQTYGQALGIASSPETRELDSGGGSLAGGPTSGGGLLGSAAKPSASNPFKGPGKGGGKKLPKGGKGSGSLRVSHGAGMRVREGHSGSLRPPTVRAKTTVATRPAAGSLLKPVKTQMPRL